MVTAHLASLASIHRCHAATSNFSSQSADQQTSWSADQGINLAAIAEYTVYVAGAEGDQFKSNLAPIEYTDYVAEAEGDQPTSWSVDQLDSYSIPTYFVTLIIISWSPLAEVCSSQFMDIYIAYMDTTLFFEW